MHSPMGAHGQGGVTLHKSGLWQVRLTMADGRRVTRYARDKRSAERLRRELVEMRASDIDPSRLTLAAFLRSWIGALRDARNQRVRPRTLDHYAMIVERHIVPALGHHRLDRLREHHVQAWLDADPGSPRTVHHHRAVLRRALNVAIRQRLLLTNPAIGVELPDATWHGAKPLTLPEAKRLLAATADDRLGALWRLALDTGLRQGELLGLGWDDVDLDAGTVTVTGQLQRRAGSWLRTETKADRALRTLAIAAPTAAALEKHRLRMAAERTPMWRYYGLVFTTEQGEPLQNHRVLDEFHAACDAAGIERRRFHDLRHASATLYRALGVAEDTRMARMGHSTTAMARRYGHAGPEQDRLAAERLGEALG
jgi:integrase